MSERDPEQAGRLQAEVSRLRALNAEMLAALKACFHDFDGDTNPEKHEFVRRVIAKAEAQNSSNVKHVCGDPSSSCDTSCEENAARGREIMNRPTAEDALKAVGALCATVLSGSNEDDIREIYRGCADLLNGFRDTRAAKEIIGESAKNSSVQGGGK